MPCNRTRLIAEIMLAIKISPVRTTEYKSIVMTAITAEGVKYKMDMDFVKDESSYAFRLVVDNDIELGYGSGKVPQVRLPCSPLLRLLFCRLLSAYHSPFLSHSHSLPPSLSFFSITFHLCRKQKLMGFVS